MRQVFALVDRLDWLTVLLLCATLGLAPFLPQPHIWEKLAMLVSGQLTRPLDMFDLVFHALPWGLAALKLGRGLRR